jgi:hypothetical protein
MILITVWLLALAVGLLSCSALVLHAAFDRGWSRVAVAMGLVGSITFCLIGMDAAGRFSTSDAGMKLALQSTAGLLVGLVVFGQLMLTRWLLRETGSGRRRAGLTALLLMQAAGTLVAGWRFENALDATMPKRFEAQLELEEIPGEALLTDRGRQITVYRARNAVSLTAAQLSSQAESLSKVSTESLHSNCHGWVFSRGRYFINDDGVEMILADNGYFVVKEPAAGDVIVYRDEDRRILHTGLVRAVDDGAIWIESKWGVGRRFIHHPEDQSYSDQFAYYRTERQPEWLKFRSRHLLKVRADPARLVAGKPRADADPAHSFAKLRVEALEDIPAWSNNDLPIGAE